MEKHFPEYRHQTMADFTAFLDIISWYDTNLVRTASIYQIQFLW